MIDVQYSGCNEDARSELRYFESGAASIFTIAAGGGRAFALLLGDPVRVTAIDTNPAQIALCELKRAALRMMARDEFLEFIGIARRSDAAPQQRLEWYERLKPDLPPTIQAYWDTRKPFIAGGLVDCGAFDRGVAAISHLVRRAAPATVTRLSTTRDAVERTSIVAAEISRRKWELVFAVAFSAVVGRRIFRDRSFCGPHRTRSGRFVLDRLREFLRAYPFDDSFIAHMYVYGHLKPDGPLPVYLEPGAYEQVQARIDRIEFVHGELVETLAQTAGGTVDAFSISDIGSYMEPADFSILLRELNRVGKRGARIVFREFLRQPRLSCEWPSSLRREPAMEALLGASDRSIAYTFVCAEVQ